MSFLQTIRKLSFSTKPPNRFAYPPAAVATEGYISDYWLLSQELCELDLAIRAKSKSSETIPKVSSGPP